MNYDTAVEDLRMFQSLARARTNTQKFSLYLIDNTARLQFLERTAIGFK